MKKETVKIIIKYAIASIIAVCFVLLNLSLRDFFKETELKEKYRMLADSFTIPGLIYVLLGLLIMLTNKGSLDALGYMVKRAVKMLVPMSKKDNMTYAEYKETKKGNTWLWFSLLYRSSCYGCWYCFYNIILSSVKKIQ